MMSFLHLSFSYGANEILTLAVFPSTSIQSALSVIPVFSAEFFTWPALTPISDQNISSGWLPINLYRIKLTYPKPTFTLPQKKKSWNFRAGRDLRVFQLKIVMWARRVLKFFVQRAGGGRAKQKSRISLKSCFTCMFGLDVWKEKSSLFFFFFPITEKDSKTERLCDLLQIIQKVSGRAWISIPIFWLLCSSALPHTPWGYYHYTWRDSIELEC